MVLVVFLYIINLKFLFLVSFTRELQPGVKSVQVVLRYVWVCG